MLNKEELQIDELCLTRFVTIHQTQMQRVATMFVLGLEQFDKNVLLSRIVQQIFVQFLFEIAQQLQVEQFAPL